MQKSSQFVVCFCFFLLCFVYFCCNYQDNYHQHYLLRGTAVSLLLKTFEQKPGLSLLRHAFAFPSSELKPYVPFDNAFNNML